MREDYKFFFECVAYGVLSAGVAIPIMILNMRLAPKLGLIDWPKARGMSEKHVPIVGYGLVLLSLSILVVLNVTHNGSPWLALTSAMMAVMGHMDDRRPIPALDKLFFQVVCICTLIFLDPEIHQ